jgi:hypothetical protein
LPRDKIDSQHSGEFLTTLVSVCAVDVRDCDDCDTDENSEQLDLTPPYEYAQTK